MKETIDKAKDFKHLLKHDRRFWAMGGFVVVVAVIMLATDTGRSGKTKKEKVIREEVVENVQPIPKEVISAVMQNMEERKKVDEELSAEINRMKNNYESSKKDINESLRGLSERVNNTSSKLSGLIDQVGEKKPHSVP